MTLEEIIRTSPAIVHSERYTYLKCKDVPPLLSGTHFAVIRDADEVTVVTEEKNIAALNYLASEGWFRMIEIRVSEPFIAKGFLAKITSAIAEHGLNILVVSSFSKDYLLLRESTYEKAVDALRQLGFLIQ